LIALSKTLKAILCSSFFSAASDKIENHSWGKEDWFAFWEAEHKAAWEINIAGKMYSAEVSLKPFYDPEMKRTKA